MYTNTILVEQPTGTTYKYMMCSSLFYSFFCSVKTVSSVCVIKVNKTSLL